MFATCLTCTSLAFEDMYKGYLIACCASKNQQAGFVSDHLLTFIGVFLPAGHQVLGQTLWKRKFHHPDPWPVSMRKGATAADQGSTKEDDSPNFVQRMGLLHR